MNEERKDVVKTTCAETATAKRSSSLSGYQPCRCILFDSHVCPHPGVCTGYDNRMCNFWMIHSGK